MPEEGRRAGVCAGLGKYVKIERLSRLPDGRLLYELRHRWRNGTAHLGFEPLEFLEKLAALVPPPRFNLVRYHGVLGPAARDRARIVPSRSTPSQGTGHAGCEAVQSETGHHDSQESPPEPRPRNHSWAELMRRVFDADVLECPACRGPMRILAAIHPPEATRAILDCLGMPTRPPPVSPASPESLTGSAEAF